MNNIAGFQRFFLIFNVEDTGYDSGQKPSGHVRIEVRDGRGKLSAVVQNINAMGEKLYYKLYLISSVKRIHAAVCAGLFQIKQNRAELEWEFDPNNVHKSGIGINAFEIAAVLVEFPDKSNTKLICPLAAYRSKKSEWRKGVEELLYKPKELIKRNSYKDITSKFDGKVESKYIPPETTTTFNSYLEKPEQSFQHPVLGVQQNENEPPEEAFSKNYGVSREYTTPNNCGENREYAPVDCNGGQFLDSTNTNCNVPINNMPVNNDGYNSNEMMPPCSTDTATPDSKCLYMNGNMCGMYLNTAGMNPCDTCSIRFQPSKTAEAEEKQGDITKLKAQLDRNFEQSDPFHSKRSDYKWWKVSNPVNLNNILYQSNIRSPLLFNPMVMMAHFKYRHLIIGIFSDKVRRREYLVCGVPGMYMTDKRPFGELCKWVQTETNRLKYGASGYWIVYIDPTTGKILSLKQ